jgi:hypothetical protein
MCGEGVVYFEGKDVASNCNGRRPLEKQYNPDKYDY